MAVYANVAGIAPLPSDVKALRQQWEQHANRALERAGLEQKIDARSYAERGIDIEAQRKLGRRGHVNWRRAGRNADRQREWQPAPIRSHAERRQPSHEWREADLRALANAPINAHGEGRRKIRDFEQEAGKARGAMRHAEYKFEKQGQRLADAQHNLEKWTARREQAFEFIRPVIEKHVSAEREHKRLEPERDRGPDRER
jgi:hypothetical protein